jgi:23S rRNA (pseudouridine1915-N3)-methyltransferase
MEINGKMLSSEELANKIEVLTNDGISEIVFVIGSSCGISPTVSQRANFKLSMSKMTFLHQFARLILVEQIYRAFKIIKGETYHK